MKIQMSVMKGLKRMYPCDEKSLLLAGILVLAVLSFFPSCTDMQCPSDHRSYFFPVAAAAHSTAGTLVHPNVSSDGVISSNSSTSIETTATTLTPSAEPTVDVLAEQGFSIQEGDGGVYFQHAYTLQGNNDSFAASESDLVICCPCSNTTTTTTRAPTVAPTTAPTSSGPDLFGLWVFIGVFASIVVVILISYVSDYIIQPVPPQKTLLPIPVINNNNNPNDYSVNGNMVNGDSGDPNSIPQIPFDAQGPDGIETTVDFNHHSDLFGKAGGSITEELLRQTPAGVLRQRHTLTGSRAGNNDVDNLTANSKWGAGTTTTTDSSSDPYGGATRTANMRHLYDEDDGDDGANESERRRPPLYDGPHHNHQHQQASWGRGSGGGGVALFDTPSSMRSGIDSTQETPMSYISSPGSSDRKHLRRRNAHPEGSSFACGAGGGSEPPFKRNKERKKGAKQDLSGSDDNEEDKSSSNSQKVIKFDAYI